MRSLEKASHGAQIISAFAVVVSILYLAGQVRDNTTAVNVATSQGLIELSLQNEAQLQDSASTEMVVRGDTLPGALSPVEWAVYERYQLGLFNIWEHAHYSFRRGTLDFALWSGWDRSYGATACKPGHRRFWEDKGEWYSDAFQDHVAEKLTAC